MATLARRTKPLRRFPGRRGAAAVEFALTVPLLFLLLFSCLELSRMNMIRHTADNAAYEAVRACIVPGATNAEGVAAAESVLRSMGLNGYEISVSPGTISRTTPSVTATISIPYARNMWVTPQFFTSGSARATCTMACDWIVSTRQGGGS